MSNRKYSIITTCKARLENLKRSLPQFCKQQGLAEVVVVDYDCPQNTAAYVEARYPFCNIVSVTNGGEGFNLSHARNIGAQHSKGDMLLFFDADIIIADDFLDNLLFPFDEDVFGVYDDRYGPSLRGSCIVKRDDFFAVDGYDELLAGYEGEDLDFYMRLRNLGLRRITLSSENINEVIGQDSEERMRYREPNVKRSFLRGRLYQHAKEMVLRSTHTNVLEIRHRRGILDAVNKQLQRVYDGAGEFNLTIELPNKYTRDLLAEWEISTAVTVRAKKKDTLPSESGSK